VPNPGDACDYLVSGLSEDQRFRVLAIKSTDLVEEARRRHNTSRTCTAALGRLLTGACLMAGTLDDNQSVTIRFLGNGPCGGIIVEAWNEGNKITTRGYMGDPSIELPITAEGKLNVSGVTGKEGFLYVTKDLGLKEQYTGSAKIQSGEIGMDLAYYHAVSEQVPSAISLGVRVSAKESEGYTVTGAGGLMVQVMPGHEDENFDDAISRIQENLENMAFLSLLIQQGEMPEDLVELVFSGVKKVDLIAKVPVVFSCRCSRERAVSTLISMGKEELERIAQEENEIEVKCHFCNEVYKFARNEMKAIIKSMQ